MSSSAPTIRTPSIPSWLPWFLIAALAAALHLAMLDRQTRAQPGGRLDRWSSIRFPDEKNYYLFCAEGVAREGAAFLNSERILRSGPVPWLWLLLWQNSILAARLANIALVLAGSFLIGRAASRAFTPRAGLVAFALCAAGYQAVLFSGTVLSEPPTFFSACLLLFASERLHSTRKPRFAILAGAACAAATLTRPGLIFLPAFLAPVFWLHLRKQKPASPDQTNPPRFSAAKTLALFLTAYALPTGACLARNAIALGVPRISNGFGAVMYLGSDLRTRADEPSFVGLDWQTSPISAPYDHMQTEGDRRLLHAAIENIRTRPGPWLALIPAKIARTLIGGPNWHFMPGDSLRAATHHHGLVRTWTRFLWWTVGGSIITTFGLAGLFLTRRSHPLLATTALSLIAYLLLLHAVSYALPRFGLVFYPALVLGAVGFFSTRRTRWLTTILASICLAIPAYLALIHDYRPSCLADRDPIDAFQISRHWQPPALNSDRLEINCNRAKPAPNSTLLLTITAQSARRHKRSVVITLTPHGPPASSTRYGKAPALPTIAFPILADGNQHTYRLGLGLNPDWLKRPWRTLAVRADGKPDDAGIVVRDVFLAH